jgi:hypothetical protein
MKTTIIFLLITIWGTSYGQDGSDIRYIKTIDIDSSFIGQYMQFDFFNRSFGGQRVDTIVINIGRKPVTFIEKRKDNGYDNWFSQQSLISVKNKNEQIVSISKFKLDNITSTSFQVTMYVEYYDNKNNILMDKSIQIDYWFDKKDIIEVLVKSN